MYPEELMEERLSSEIESLKTVEDTIRNLRQAKEAQLRILYLSRMENSVEHASDEINSTVEFTS